MSGDRTPNAIRRSKDIYSQVTPTRPSYIADHIAASKIGRINMSKMFRPMMASWTQLAILHTLVPFNVPCVILAEIVWIEFREVEDFVG